MSSISKVRGALVKRGESVSRMTVSRRLLQKFRPKILQVCKKTEANTSNEGRAVSLCQETSELDDKRVGQSRVLQ